MSPSIISLAQTRRILETTGAVVAAIPIAGPQSKAILDLAIKICKSAEEVKSIKLDSWDLAQHAAICSTTVAQEIQNRINLMSEVASNGSLANEQELVAVASVLTEIQVFYARRVRLNRISRWYHKQQDKDAIQSLKTKLTNTLTRFDLASHISEGTSLNFIQEICRAMLADGDTMVLQHLVPTHEARFDAQGAASGCLPSTRVQLLDDVASWINTPSSEQSRILNVAGPVGFGKTAIAKSICERLQGDNRLGASFFISAQSKERCDPHTIVRTLAYQLAFSRPILRRRICTAIRNHPDIATSSLRNQITHLIWQPLQGEARKLRPTVIVIDALDECGQFYEEDGPRLLDYLTRVINKTSADIRLVFTSTRSHSTLDVSHTIILLQNIGLSVVSRDIQRYLESGFRTIALTHPHKAQIGKSWPRRADTAPLIQQCGRFFLFASMILRYVGSDYHHPPERLAGILAGAGNDTMFKSIDALYLQILHAVAKKIPREEVGEVCERWKNVAGAVVLLQTPLSEAAFSRLMKFHPQNTRSDLEALSAFINVPEENTLDLIRPFHSSFGGFLTNPKRCEDKRFYADPVVHHRSIALRCLYIMYESLHKDMCGIGNGIWINDGVPDLNNKLRTSLSPEVRYACKYWMAHLRYASCMDMDLCDIFLVFVPKLLYWIEVLGLLNAIPRAQMILRDAIQWCGEYNHLREARTHMQEIYRCIADNPGIYVAALAIYQLFPQISLPQNSNVRSRRSAVQLKNALAASAPAHVRRSPRPIASLQQEYSEISSTISSTPIKTITTPAVRPIETTLSSTNNDSRRVNPIQIPISPLISDRTSSSDARLGAATETPITSPTVDAPTGTLLGLHERPDCAILKNIAEDNRDKLSQIGLEPPDLIMPNHDIPKHALQPRTSIIRIKTNASAEDQPFMPGRWR